VHAVVKGDTGHVGIGTQAPQSRLHVAQDAHLNAVFDRTDVSEHLTAVVGSDGSGLRFSDTNEFFIASQAYANRSDNTFGNEHLRIKANGNLGIGTTVPTARLDVQGNADQPGTVQLRPAPAKGPFLSHVHWGPTGDWYIRSAAVNGNVVIQDTGGRVGIGTSAPQRALHVVGDRIRLGGNNKRIDLRTDGGAVDLHSETDNLYIRSNGAGGKNNVIVNPFAGDGNVGIGTEQPAAKLHVNGTLRLNGDAFISFGGLWTTSDREEKEEIEAIDRPLDRLLALQGVSFAWKRAAKAATAPDRQIGFVAQDVEKVFPEWVKDTPWGTKAVNVAGLNALVVEAMRELVAKVERLEAEVAELRARAAKPTAREKPARKRATARKAR
jgi:hypothetical protein